MVLILSASCPQVNTVSLLSRNYSFADKQERTVGRSKVVQKFLLMVETFSLYKYKTEAHVPGFYEFAPQILLNAR